MIHGATRYPTDRTSNRNARTGGGLPAADGVLILGGPGSGKTVLCLQILAGTIANRENGLLISFEESPDQILRDADSFDWGQSLIEAGNWTALDGRPPVDATVSGGFDLEGLLAMTETRRC